MMGKEETLAETEISWPMTALRNSWSNNRATSGTIWGGGGGGGGDVQNYCHWVFYNSHICNRTTFEITKFIVIVAGNLIVLVVETILYNYSR